MSTLQICDLLSLIDASGGKIEHRVRLQKEVFLLRWAGFPILPTLRFTYDAHGPYSRELSDVLHRAVVSGYLNEKDAGGIYVYEMTAEASALLGRWRDVIGPVMALLNSEHWSALELAATALYLQEDERAAKPLWERALALRPTTSSFLERARGLVDELSGFRAKNVAERGAQMHA